MADDYCNCAPDGAIERFNSEEAEQVDVSLKEWIEQRESDVGGQEHVRRSPRRIPGSRQAARSGTARHAWGDVFIKFETNTVENLD